MSELTRVTESIEEIRANAARVLQVLAAGTVTQQRFAPIWRDEVKIVWPSRAAPNVEDDPRCIGTA